MPDVRHEILHTILIQKNKKWYLSRIARHLHRSPSSLQRELDALVAGEILQTYRDGNRIYYEPDPNCPIIEELQEILVKTGGIVEILRRILARFSSDIDCAFIYGSMARGEEVAESDIDLMIIGKITLSKIAPLIRRAEKRLERSINPIIFTRKETEEKLQKEDHFLKTAVSDEYIILIDNGNSFAEIFGQKVRSSSPNKQKRGRKSAKNR